MHGAPPMTTLALTAWAAVGLGVGFALLYALARGLNNYGIVDIAWSYAFTAVVAFYALGGTGWPVRRALVAAMVSLWSLRLGTHLLLRVASRHPIEDTRYAQLRRAWSANFHMKMFGFFQLQAASVAVLAFVFLIVGQNASPHLHALELAGAALWLAAISGEALADAQLGAFKRDIANRGEVCTTGLWRYSRHPNYFFEWLVWVAYFVVALASPGGWIAAVGPAGMLFLLLLVTCWYRR